METRQLRYFVTVAEELHFGNAAKRLNLSQPPLSQQIMKFEDELGVKLFERNKRSVKLTAAGKSLLQDAYAILKSIAKAKQNLQEVALGKKGQLRLGYIGPAMDGALADIIREYKAKYPDVTFILDEMSTNLQLKEAAQGRIDVGVVRLFKHDLGDLKGKVFHKERYAVAVPSAHKFSSKSEIDVAELAGEPLIFQPRESQPRLYDEWFRVFAEAGFSPRVVQESVTKSASLALAAAGIGLAIVPESLAKRRLAGVQFKPLAGNIPSLEMHIIYNSNQVFPALENFLKIVSEISRCDFWDNVL
ncbi:LysR substrate-binding domain-containing protein [Desulfovibrio sp. UCD-KL4C]|uniref:LysR substrate-binding domain-containing protein n=1 Tax=Desulfovibrio sp. UCD-KL4C TaxID=2578120 RepID=UPI0025BE7D4F|nr:LysR substrate-binding domain-containing protein [Desulfovibrio sp. UCD-KL4C]